MITNYYFLTIGEAWLAFANFVASLVSAGNTPSAGFGISVVAGSPSANGYIVVYWGATTAYNYYYFREGRYAPNIPFRQVLTQPEFGVPIQMSDTGNPSGTLTFTSVIGSMTFAKGQIIATQCGQTYRVGGVSDYGFPSAPLVMVATVSAYVTDGIDLIVTSDAYINTAAALDAAGVWLPNSPVLPTLQVVSSGGGGVVVNAAPPMDLDVSVNQGQAILSVYSRTTTMIP
jgi:hypothetical protein